MKPAPRSTAFPVLTIAALALGLVFSAWCVSLAISVEVMRRDIAVHVGLLQGLDNLRTDLLALEQFALRRYDVAGEPLAPRWRDEYARVLSAFQQLDAGVRLPGDVRQRLEEIEGALGAVNDAAQPLLAAGPDQPGIRSLEDRLRRGQLDALDRVGTAIAAIRAHQAAVSRTLGRSWRSLYVLALISLAGIVFSRSVRVGGDEKDEAIVQYMKRVYNLMIGERTAEEIKIAIGSAFPMGEETTIEVKGRDLVAGLPKTLTLTSEEVREALQEPISTIVDAVRITLERCPPELSADLVDRGLILAGGGALGDSLEDVGDLAAGGQYLDRRVHQAGGADDLLDDLAAALL